MSLWVSPDLSELARGRTEEALRGAVPEASVEVVTRILRRVLRIDLPGEDSLYCKQNLFPFVRLRLRYLLKSSPTQKERKLLDACRRRGIVCPKPLAEATQRGLLGPGLAVLVTRALAEGRAPTAREHLSAAEELAKKGLYHPDLHGDNLRILEDGALATMDLQSCRLSSGALGSAATCRMMAKAALAICDEHGESQIESILLEERWSQPGARILVAMRRLARRRLASRRRHFLRTSSKVLASRPSMGRKRLILQGARLAGGYSEPIRREITGLGPCDISRKDGGHWCVESPGDLRNLWLASLFRSEESGERCHVFAWEGPSRIPFGFPFGGEVLYISGCTTESHLESLIYSLLNTHIPEVRVTEIRLRGSRASDSPASGRQT